ncbi:hypothetical protein E4T43_04955 [Aureobasidium subglaciale]|nr:hypothetical protein E4T43_04955 [Aureobasidium subglaciale]
MAPRRWLWPCSDSHVLRLPAYQKPTLHACLVHPERPDHVLVHDSDDDLDDDYHTAKRRRIEAIAHSFLNGQPIYIPSASLKGPFPADRDLSLCHDPFSTSDAEPEPVSPPPALTADSFIRRRPEHRPQQKSPSPEPVFSPDKSHSSSPSGSERPASRPKSSYEPPRSSKTKSLRFDLPSSAPVPPTPVLPPLPKFLAINKLPAQPDNPTTSTASSRPPPRVLIPDSSFISPSPPPSVSPCKAVGVLRQRPASSLNEAEKAPSSIHKLSSVKKNKRPIKRVYQAAVTSGTTSPFIYRKNAIHAKKTTAPAKEERARADDVHVGPNPANVQSKTPLSTSKRQHVLFQSSTDDSESKPSHPLPTAVESVRSPEPVQDLVPAINMSFGQESFGMDFNMINHYNNPMTASSMGERGTGEHRHDQGAPAASGVSVPNTNATNLETEKAQPGETEPQAEALEGYNEEEPVAKALHKSEEEDKSCDFRESSLPHDEAKVVDFPMEDPIVDKARRFEAEVVDELPYISTQAAMQDAHRALFDASSPLQQEEEVIQLPFETPAKQVTSPPSSPVHAITPFHQFNAELTNDTQAPLPNTQALFDGFYSPIKLSAKKPRIAKRASFAPSVIPEDPDDTIASAFDLQNDTVAQEHNQDRMSSNPDEVVAADDQMHSPVPTVPSPAILEGRTSPSFPQDLARNSPSPSPASRSDSPDFILSQKTPAPLRDSTGHVIPALQQDSVSLSEMLNFVSSRRGIDIETLLSQTTPVSSARSVNKKQTSARSSQQKPRTSLPKSRSSQPSRPRSSLPKSVSEQKTGQRRSTRLSLSQPNPQTDGADDDFDTDIDIDGPPATQPHLNFDDLGRSFGSLSSTVPDVSSTIPDPSLAINYAQQNGTPLSGKPAPTPGSALQSTGLMSSFQHAQKQYSSLTDLDSTMPDLPQTFLPPVH